MVLQRHKAESAITKAPLFKAAQAIDPSMRVALVRDYFVGACV